MLRVTTALLTVILLTIPLGPALADGVLVPGDWTNPSHVIVAPQRMPFSIKYHHVDVTIDGQLARTHIDQVFTSDYDRDLEGTYIFPIPEGAAVKDFRLWLGNEPVQGEILDADEARRIYEAIVRKRRDPALLEYAGRGMFRARVYPIPAHGEARIELEYTEILSEQNSTVTYIYPLDTERFSAKPIESVRVYIDLHSKVPIRNIYSPLPGVSIRRPDDHSATLTYEKSNVKPDRDLVAYYTLSEDDIGLGLVTYKPRDEDGYFMLLAAPKVEVQQHEIEAKDVVFVFDRTGSMAGEKIEQAKGALKYCLRSLNPADRFNVIVFNEQPDRVFQNLVEATRENISKAIEHIDAMDARGGTNIDLALETTFHMLEGEDRPAFVLFLTDGLPTVGIVDVRKILARTDSIAPPQVRLFAFGVGYDVNTNLLDKLSLQHRGATQYVRPEEDIEVKVSNLYAMISYPILTDIKIDYGSMGIYDVFPTQLSDVFKGSQIILTGRYRGSGTAKIVLEGKAEGQTQRFELVQSLEEKNRLSDYVPYVWAQRKIGFLLDEIRLHGSQDELIDEIVRLSKRFGIVTPYTSYLVREPEKVTQANFAYTARRSVMQSVRAPSTGKAAVDQSVRMSQLRMASKAVGQTLILDGEKIETSRAIRNVGTRTFYLTENTWVESNYTEGQEVLKIRVYSKAQSQLLERDPSLGKVMALGENVIFLVSGKAIEIGDEGLEELSEEDLQRLFG